MQKTVRNISAAQLVLLLLVSRMFTLFTFAPRSDTASGSTTLLAIPLGALATLLLLLPFWWLRKKGDSLLAAARSVGRLYGGVVALLFGCYALAMAGYTISHFEFFMTSTVYQGSRPWFFIICLTLAAGYGARLGLEAFSRLGAFFFALLLGVGALICIGLIPEMELSRVVSPFLQGGQTLFAAVMHAVLGNAEVIGFILLCPRAEKAGPGAFAWYAGLSAVLIELLSFVVLVSLGDYAGTRLFPFYTAASAAQLSIFGRLDILHIALWVFLAFLRSTLYLYCASVCLRSLFPKLAFPWSATFCALAGGVVAVLFSSEVRWLEAAGRLLADGMPLVVLAAGIPLLTALLIPKKKKEAAA